jgi:A nuclease family of the HNH/ENDO VII superfamily with conserved AHH
MADANATHMTEAALATLHDESCTTDGSGTGACLTAHAPPGKLIPEYNKNHSCSYRWQAHQVSLDQRKHLYNDAHTKGIPEHWKKRVYLDKKTKAESLMGVPLPQAGDWDLGGPPAGRLAELQRINPKKSLHGVTSGAIENFVSNAQWPYFFNCHHMIPKGLFNRVIDELAQEHCPDAPTECALAIRYRLLKAKYNIHHKVNMVMLPNMPAAAGILGLPRHLTRKPQPSEKTFVQKEFRSHQQYDNSVRDLLQNALLPAIKAFVVDSCKMGDLDLLKADLEIVSQDCFSSILQLGAARDGRPLAMIRTKKKK